MSKRNYLAGKKYGLYYKDFSLDEKVKIRDRYLRKSKNIEINNTFLRPNQIESRIDFYCGVIDYLNKVIKDEKKD